MPTGTRMAGNDLELRGGFLDCLIPIDGLDGAERPELGGGAVDCPRWSASAVPVSSPCRSVPSQAPRDNEQDDGDCREEGCEGVGVSKY
jgi:hypothetical protein